MESLYTEAFYIQVGLILVSLLVSILVSGLFRRVVLPVLLEKSHKELLTGLAKKLTKLITPFLFILLLAFSYEAASEVPVSTVIIKGMSKLAYVWFVTRIILLVISNRAVAVFISIVAMIIAALDVTGLLATTTKYLDGITMQFGTVKVTMLGISKGVVYCVLLFWMARGAARTLEAMLRKRATSLNYGSRELIIKFLHIFFYVVAAVITLNVVGVDLTALTVFGGALAVGIGFGLQKITSNFISGIILLFEDSVKEGDFIEVSGQSGWVRQSGVRYTMIETLDGKEILIPNEELVTSRVTNWTLSNSRARTNLIIGVSYKSDLRLAAKLIQEAADDHPRCLKDPEPMVFLKEFADNSVTFELMFWVYDMKEGLLRPKSDILFSIWEKFNANGIEIPYPQRDITIKSMPQLVTTVSS